MDQTFSKISHRLKKNSALTLEHLLKEIQESQQSSNNIGQTKPVTECLDHVWDISGWLDDYVNQVHNVTYPHVYRLVFKTVALVNGFVIAISSLGYESM